MPPSRLVGLVDALADRGLVERHRNPDDRRLHALYLTDDGQTMLGRIATLGREHDDAICRSLDTAERVQLRALLARMADDHNLQPGSTRVTDGSDAISSSACSCPPPRGRGARPPRPPRPCSPGPSR
jgi:hypothetical protein